MIAVKAKLDLSRLKRDAGGIQVFSGVGLGDHKKRTVQDLAWCDQSLRERDRACHPVIG